MSNVIKFGLLIVCAALVAMIVRVVVISASHTASPTVNTKHVRVSAGDLPQGLLLRDEDLTWKDIPVEKLPTNAIIAGVPGAVELKGALLRHPVPKDTILVSDDVILPSDPGFLAATLKPGMRAVSVAVDDVSGNAGLIQPGDYVDVLLTQQMEHKAESADYSVSSETVVEHVRVLASGSEITRPKGTNPAEANNRARTVTLEVTPHLGEVVAVAARLGSLSLALRSFATDAREGQATRDPNAPLTSVAMPVAASDAQQRPVWAGDISRALRQLPQARQPSVESGVAPQVRAPAPVPTVAIYRGSEKQDNGSADGAATAGAGPNSAVPPLPALR
jgi:pilus assembly protein CpaB